MRECLFICFEIPKRRAVRGVPGDLVTDRSKNYLGSPSFSLSTTSTTSFSTFLLFNFVLDVVGGLRLSCTPLYFGLVDRLDDNAVQGW